MQDRLGVQTKMETAAPVSGRYFPYSWATPNVPAPRRRRGGALSGSYFSTSERSSFSSRHHLHTSCSILNVHIHQIFHRDGHGIHATKRKIIRRRSRMMDYSRFYMCIMYLVNHVTKMQLLIIGKF
ncbi:hypothetical protein GWI33_000010 [Rhynchophorus ferrugineus]|uniref:Uncharacterized protein n=1 Tax=Rhynchophorus ferrugineus TaxID=354439 RepID=A0A834IWZ5_RHYFE|nr:hypothetical protein GWI33_000010 [Rhynchophorus ferrugineus]